MIKNSTSKKERFLKGFKNLSRLVLPVFVVLTFSACKKNYAKIPEEPKKIELSDEEYIERGKYLVNSIGCHDCHSPKRMGEHGPEVIPELAYSGFQGSQPLPELSKDAMEKGWMLMNGDLTAAVGPWGISYAANLTSDETGIGTWSEEQFKRALTQGKFKGQENGRTLLPPMPWENYKNMKDEDLKAIYYYLQSTTPVENAVPAPVPPQQLESPKPRA